MEPDSFVAYIVTPLAVNETSFSVPVSPSSWIAVVAFDMAIEPTVNSITSTVPPPATGKSTLPWYLKSVIVAESTLIVHVAEDTTRPGAAVASFGVGDAETVGDRLTVGDGLPVGDGVPVAEALGLGEPLADPDALGVAVASAVPVGSVTVGTAVAEALGVGDADADGVAETDEADADGLGLALGLPLALGLGLGLADEPKQMTTKMQVWAGVDWPACAAASARPSPIPRAPPIPRVPTVSSSETRASRAGRFMPVPRPQPASTRKRSIRR
jgi:hypothetical protein